MTKRQLAEKVQNGAKILSNAFNFHKIHLSTGTGTAPG